MPGATHPERRTIADSRFGSGAPVTWWAMLFATLPGDDGLGGVEVTGGGYARPAIANNVTSFPAATTASGRTTKSNGVKVTYGDPTADWGTVVGFGWVDAATGGTPKYYGKFDGDAVLTVKASLTVVEFDVGQLIWAW